MPGLPPRPSRTRVRDPRKQAKKELLGTHVDWAAFVPGSSTNTSSASTRSPSFNDWPTLSNCAIRSFSKAFKDMTGNEGFLQYVGEMFGHLGDEMGCRVWNRLVLECPEVFTLGVIQKLCLASSSLKLPGVHLPCIENATNLVPLKFTNQMDPGLITSLEISNAPKLSDVAVAAMLFKLPNVTKIVLRGTTEAGSKCVTNIISKASQITFLNLSGTSLDMHMLKGIIMNCLEIKVLKFASCKKLLSMPRGRATWGELIREIRIKQGGKSRREPFVYPRSGPGNGQELAGETVMMDEAVTSGGIDTIDVDQGGNRVPETEKEGPAGSKIRTGPLHALEKLKIRDALSLSFDMDMLYSLLELCPTLRHLDISYNPSLIRGTYCGPPPIMPNLVKLNMVGVPFQLQYLKGWMAATAIPDPTTADGERYADPDYKGKDAGEVIETNTPLPFWASHPEKKHDFLHLHPCFRSRLVSLQTNYPLETNSHPEWLEWIRSARSLEKLRLHFTGEGQKRSADQLRNTVCEILGSLDEDDGTIQTWSKLKSLTFSAFRATTSAELKYQPKAKPKVKLPKSSKKKTPNESEEDGMAPPPVVNESLERLDFGGMHMVRGLLIGKGWAEVIGRFKNLRYLEASGSRLTLEDLMYIIDNCPYIHTIDVTGNRELHLVQQRRTLFEIWQERQIALEGMLAVPLEFSSQTVDDMMDIWNTEATAAEDAIPQAEGSSPDSDEAVDQAETGHQNNDHPAAATVETGSGLEAASLAEMDGVAADADSEQAVQVATRAAVVIENGSESNDSATNVAPGVQLASDSGQRRKRGRSLTPETDRPMPKRARVDGADGLAHNLTDQPPSMNTSTPPIGAAVASRVWAIEMKIAGQLSR